MRPRNRLKKGQFPSFTVKTIADPDRCRVLCSQGGHSMRSGCLITVLWLAACLPTELAGQAVYGSIVGTVTDSSGAAVPKAKVTIADVGKGVNYTTTTNDSGNYSQTHLIAGIICSRGVVDALTDVRDRDL